MIQNDLKYGKIYDLVALKFIFANAKIQDNYSKGGGVQSTSSKNLLPEARNKSFDLHEF